MKEVQEQLDDSIQTFWKEKTEWVHKDTNIIFATCVADQGLTPHDHSLQLQIIIQNIGPFPAFKSAP